MVYYFSLPGSPREGRSPQPIIYWLFAERSDNVPDGTSIAGGTSDVKLFDFTITNTTTSNDFSINSASFFVFASGPAPTGVLSNVRLVQNGTIIMATSTLPFGAITVAINDFVIPAAGNGKISLYADVMPVASSTDLSINLVDLRATDVNHFRYPVARLSDGQPLSSLSPLHSALFNIVP